MTPIKAVILDLDGTLYRQSPVRRQMAVRLAAYVARHPKIGWRTMRFVSAYRRAQERLREAGRSCGDEAQLALACEQTGADPEWASEVLARWMEVAPLDLVRRYMRPDLIPFLEAGRRRAVRLAVFSDYPAEAKLAAMGIRSHFDAVRWAQEPEIAAFKPDPRGLRSTLTALGVDSSEALHVGDRPSVDAAAALAAGMRAAIISAHPPSSHHPCLHVHTFAELTVKLGWLPP